MAPAFVMSFDARLAEVAAISSSTERLAAYAAFLDDVLQVRDVHDLATLLEAYVRGALLHRVNTAGAGLLVGRRLVPELLTQLEHASKVEASPLHDATTMCDEILPLIVPQLETHTALWDDELVAWRQWHAQQLEQLQRFREAACVLQACTPEAVRAARQASWPALCVKVVQLWLAAGDEAAAEHAFKSAKAAIHTVRDDEALWHDFCLCQAHLLASQQRFCDAAQRCMELGQSPRLAAAEQNTMTQLAALHALAASPSAARTQLLHQLAEDDRSWTWPFATALHRAARGQALRPVDTHTLAPVWHACHLAPASFGLSAAALAMSEHTLCALARSFSAVPLVGLAAHAQLDADVCEKILARLLAQAQLPPGSYVDQVQGVMVLGDALSSDASGKEASDIRIETALASLDAAYVRVSS